jgi:acyl-CoA thioesterase-1
MKIHLPVLAFLLFLTTSATAQPQPDAGATKAPAKKKAPGFAVVKDDPKLPRVLLIGDSISIGYTLPVRELLKGKANVHRIPANGGPTTNGLANLSKWLGDGKWDVIHFNWGLHDLKYFADGNQMVPPAQYEKNLRELVKQLKATGAKLIWATTTPVPEGKLNPERKATDVAVYNAAAQRVMEENKIVTDDLYTFALPQLSKIQLPLNVHYTTEGYQELAKAVAASIEKAVAARK